MTHEDYMRQALELARACLPDGDVPVGCVVVSPVGEVIGRGRNRREAEGCAAAHAEIEAITQACRRLGSWRLTGCVLYVTLEPCPCAPGPSSTPGSRSCVMGPGRRSRAAAVPCSICLRNASTTDPVSTAACWQRNLPPY